MYEAQFDATGTILWQEAQPKPVDMARYQKAMFTDRPDLWPRKPSKRRKAAIRHDEQLDLFNETTQEGE